VLGLASLAASGRTTIFGAPPEPVASWMPMPRAVIVQARPAAGEALVDAVLRR